MKGFGKYIFVVSLALVLASSAFSTQRNAFLSRAAYTKQALLMQLRSDPKVMDRFMRHFAMSRQEVLDYFSSLRLATLKHDGIFAVYNVPKTGELRAKAYRLKKGTRVWVDQTGKPVLKASCGNPLTRGPNMPEAESSSLFIPDVSDQVLRELIAEEPSAEAEPDIVADIAQPPVPDVVAEVVPEGPNIPPAPPKGVTIPSNAGSVPFIAALPFVLLGFSVSVGGTKPIPEPASFMALALGAGMLMVHVRAKAKKAR